MSETGATKEQIEAAVARIAGTSSNGPWVIRPMVKMVAPALVTSTDRIVAVDDLTGVLDLLMFHGHADIGAARDRIRALIGGDA